MYSADSSGPCAKPTPTALGTRLLKCGVNPAAIIYVLSQMLVVGGETEGTGHYEDKVLRFVLLFSALQPSLLTSQFALDPQIHQGLSPTFSYISYTFF